MGKQVGVILDRVAVHAVHMHIAAAVVGEAVAASVPVAHDDPTGAEVQEAAVGAEFPL